MTGGFNTNFQGGKPIRASYYPKYIKYKTKYDNLKKGLYDDKFWNLMNQYNQILEKENQYKDSFNEDTNSTLFIKNIPKKERIKFIKKYNEITDHISKLMFGQHTCAAPIGQDGYCNKSLYSKYVGADDGHADLVRYIVRSGRAATETFISDPQNSLIYQLANQMRSEYTAIDNFDTNGELRPS